jgi:hypothetical protein
MPNSASGLEATTITCAEGELAIAQKQRGGSRYDVNELVLFRVVMQQRWHRSGSQFGEIDTEVGKTKVIAETVLNAPLNPRGKGRRIDRLPI